MSNLQHRQDKIQEKRKKTPWRDFVMEIASWTPLNLYKKNNFITCYPDPIRSGPLTDLNNYYTHHSDTMEENIEGEQDLFKSIISLFQVRHKPRVTQFAQNENVDYANFVFGVKNAYLSFIIGDDCEDVIYSAMIYYHCTNIYNSTMISNYSENIFDSTYVTHSYNIFSSFNIHNSNNIRNSTNLIGCNECIGCLDLENQSYCIDNISYSKDEYLSIKKKHEYMNYGSSYSLNKGTNFNSIDSQGSGLNNCENVNNGLLVSQIKDGRNVVCIGGGESSSSFYDVFEAGINSHHFYGVGNSGTFSEHIYCSIGVSQKSSNIYYSYHIDNCSFCLGCIGLKNKSYCILNKQYTKEERYEKVDEIFGQMEADGTLGQFFPAKMNPFYFNDTAAYLIDPTFTKEEVTAAGYLRRDEPIKVDIPEGAQTITVDELASYESRVDNQRTIDELICKKVIIDHKGNAYRIIPMELEFLKKHGLPLPRKHWLDRMKENFRIS